MSDKHVTETAEAYRTGLLAGEPRQALPPTGVPYLVVPNDAKVESLEHLLPRPILKESNPLFFSSADFCDYVKEFHAAGQSKVFCVLTDAAMELTAILDFHSQQSPTWCKDRARYIPKLTNEWREWKARSGRAMTQLDFAEFLEMRSLDIVVPDGATLLEVCSNLSSKKSVTFRSSIRLSDGQTQFAYEEEGQSDSPKGNMIIPSKFELGIRIFEDDEIGAKVECLLRHRINDGKLSFTYVIVQPDKVVERMAQKKIQAIRDGLPQSVKVYNGSYSQ